MEMTSEQIKSLYSFFISIFLVSGIINSIINVILYALYKGIKQYIKNKKGEWQQMKYILFLGLKIFLLSLLIAFVGFLFLKFVDFLVGSDNKWNVLNVVMKCV